MSIVEAIILGLVQGLTEFIPVSSSGHLVLTQALMGRESSHLLIQSLDIGTLLALVVYFWPKLLAIARSVLFEKNYRLFRNVILTSIPAGVIGLLMAGFIEKSAFFGLPIVISVGLIVVGVLMVIIDKLPKKSSVASGEALPASRAFLIGVAQVAALVPGVSRSGSTIITGRLMGLTAAKAAEYSFLVSIPIMFGLVGKLLITSSDRAFLATHIQTVVVGNLAAFISGLLAVGFLLRFLSTHSLKSFGWYRIVLGLLVVVLVLFGYL